MSRSPSPPGAQNGAAGGPKLKRSMGLWMATALTERPAFSTRHFLRDMTIAALAFAYSVWAIAGSGQEIIAKGFVLLLAGVPIYIGMTWWQQRDAGRTAVALTLPAEGEGARRAPERAPVLTAAGNGRREA